MTYQLVHSKGGCGEGVAFAAANLALLSTPSQDLINVLFSKRCFFLLGFFFFANLQSQQSNQVQSCMQHCCSYKDETASHDKP